MLPILFTLNLSNIKNNNLMQPENQSWIVTFIKLTDLNLKFASPNCSILKKKGHKYAAIDIFWRCWDESYILCYTMFLLRSRRFARCFSTCALFPLLSPFPSLARLPPTRTREPNSFKLVQQPALGVPAYAGATR